MKIPRLLGATALPVMASLLFASCTTGPQVAGPQQTRGGLIFDNQERYAVVTGSYLPQKVRKQSIGTNSVNNVRIVTQEELRATNGGFGLGGLSTVGY